jgi:hypothetical protein
MSTETRVVGKAVREYVETTKQPVYNKIPARLSNEVDADESAILDALDWMIEQGLLYPVEQGGKTVVKVA